MKQRAKSRDHATANFNVVMFYPLLPFRQYSQDDTGQYALHRPPGFGGNSIFSCDASSSFTRSSTAGHALRIAGRVDVGEDVARSVAHLRPPLKVAASEQVAQ